MVDDGNRLEAADEDKDGPDSSWTIEAVNSESDEEEEPTEVRPITRTIWARPSITRESGGKEILYPLKMSRDLSKQPLPSEPLRLHDESPHAHLSKPPSIDFIAQTSPPSAFAPLRKAKKHTSEEFEINSVRTLVSKSSGNQIEGNGKVSTRKHCCLGGGSLSRPTTSWERGRHDTIDLSASVPPKVSTTGHLDWHI